MKHESGYITRIFQTLSEQIHSKATQARIRFQETETNITETAEQSLLRRRIGAAALVLLTVKIVFTSRSLQQVGHAAPLDGVILVGLLATVVWLYGTRNASMFWLRAVETAIFLGMSFQLGLQLHQQLGHLTEGEPRQVTDISYNAIRFVAIVKDQIIATFGMMMIYGMFIPNTARRAALMVFLMAIAPGIVIGVNESSTAVIKRFRSEHVAARGIFTGNLLALAAGAGCAIYGTAIMNRWRSRALEAEQLGQYRLKYRIGSGGMGDVYLAEHRLLKRTCAVKLIRAELSEDPVVVGLFEREVQATATLTHWNTIQVFDYGQTAEGTFFYVMEYLHGRNLRQLVTEFGPMPESRVVFVLRQVCEALREAASQGLVHRDIKPSNIFLACVGARHDVVKLLDFGLVRPLASMADPELSGTNQLKGSPRYMCPEQAQGNSPDCRGDIYSLGATAFFVLTGRPPFDLESTLQLVIAHATKQPPTFADLGVEVSTDLEAIIQKCLQKNPGDRFQTPDEMLTALNRITCHDSWAWSDAEQWWTKHLPRTDDEDNSPTVDLKVLSEPGDESSALDETVIDSPLTTRQ